MSKVAFPKRRADGTFCIEIHLSVVTDNSEQLIQAIDGWAIEWRRANSVWVRRWEPEGRVEELSYNEEFKGPLQTVFCDGSELKLRIAGQPNAKWWRDWLVSRIIPELKQRFNEIGGVVQFKDC